jgi:hypothetical protein
MTTSCVPDRKFMSKGAETVRKLNGHPTPDVSIIQQCGEQLRPLCPLSLADFKQLPTAQRRTLRCAVRGALKLKSLLTDEEVYGHFNNLLGQCKNPMGQGTDRTALSRLLHYFASTVQ